MSVNSSRKHLLECSNSSDGRFEQGNEYQNVVDQKIEEIRHIMSELLLFKAKKQEEMLFVRSLNWKLEKSRKRMRELRTSDKPFEQQIKRRKRVMFSPNIEIIMIDEEGESTSSFKRFETATIDEKSNRTSKRASIVKGIRRFYRRLGGFFRKNQD